ncbi:MAG: anti-sigma factor [Propionibacteriales bacterium]|nr:anti-sigma factor [Propionibacteriales bacterium]
MTAHEIHALAGAYAVDALDQLERSRFEAHLAVCAECRDEVLSLQDATLLLSELTAVAPPASMRAAVLTDIRKIRPIPPAVVAIDRRRPRPRLFTNLLAAAAVLGVLGTGAVVIDQAGNDNTAVQLSAADRVLTAVDVEHYNVDFVSGASATVSRSASEGRAVLVARGMKAAPADHVYQLWLIKNGKMVPAGFMSGGTDLSTELLDGNANEATGVGITIEPSGGSTSPTEDPIAEFDFEPKTT